MGRTELLVGVLAGVVQGVLEWLPVSSQGNLALLLSAVGTEPDVALQLALFLQVGTALSAAAYYRADLRTVAGTAAGWRPGSAYEADNALFSYLVVASAVTGLIGVPLYVFAVDLAGEVSGAVFVGVVGVLLVLTGAVQLATESVSMGHREQPTLADSVLVGAVQGVAVLPGVSRSGVTAGALLFRSYDPPEAFHLSFLLSIPASLGAAALTLTGAGGLPGIDPGGALAALLTSAVVGYLAIGAIVRVVDRVPFWTVCVGLGSLAILGALAVT